MDIPDFKTCKVIKIEFNKQIIDRCDSKIDFRALCHGNQFLSEGIKQRRKNAKVRA